MIGDEPHSPGAYIPEIPARDDLIGATEADNERHVMARVAFIKQISTDPRVEALFDGWSERMGRGNPGWEDRLRFVQFGSEAVRFVRDELGLSWAWLAVELVEGFLLGVEGEQDGVTYSRNTWYEPLDPPSPLIRQTFRTMPGESLSQAEARFAEFVESVEERFAGARTAGAIPAGRSSQYETIARYVDWFYRARVKQPPESVRALARQENTGPKTIRDGIRDAERVLCLGAYAL